jgi:hypothetical protein
MADKILVFGASQRTGLEVSRLLVGRGDKVRAFVRGGLCGLLREPAKPLVIESDTKAYNSI